MDKRIILAGGGHAHLAVLADWARHPIEGTERSLITSARYTAYSGMLPGWIAGIYRANDLLIDLKPLAERAGAKLILADVIGLDAERRTLELSNGDAMEFDLLSLATGGEIDASNLATLGERLLSVRPVDAFMNSWSRFLETSALAATLHVAVIGGGAAGVELALAVQTVLRSLFRQPRIALVTPQEGFLAGHADKVKRLALGELSERGISLHFAEAAGVPDGLLLSNGAHISADCVIAATGSRAPRWLARSGLACNKAGFVAVGAEMRSISHPSIFAAGDIIDRADRSLERSGVHAVKTGPVLASNLRAAIHDTQFSKYQPKSRTLYLLALGDRRAIVSWGGFVAIGRWAWRLKDWIDRYFVSRYTDPALQGR